MKTFSLIEIQCRIDAVEKHLLHTQFVVAEFNFNIIKFVNDQILCTANMYCKYSLINFMI